ncbi:zinc-ribbon domain containing protein [Eleftheria terrae]|uniref:zinc-ribbon domain containing protein n=1 Tax=Eleftheria terrae TaxID=1597781 RepID=UPI00263BA336|nr:zinc-ribbon domain containing protein [Eleftheria terrae]WKB51000.1 zinc-ribbon domain-containing protein [Eleftheria terrae]
MKSGKQRRVEILARRRQRARTARCWPGQDTRTGSLPAGAVAATPSQLRHNCLCSPLPDFYVDRPFRCRDCGIACVWRAERQKWWYEVAKGSIWSTAVRCAACRERQRERRAQARAAHLAGLARQAALAALNNKEKNKP